MTVSTTAMTTTRGQRLRAARKRHFKSARAAAKHLVVAPATYGAHERAEAPSGRGRDYGPEEARLYGKRFGVRPEWLLTGEEPMKASALAGKGESSPILPQELMERLNRLAEAVDRNTAAVERLLDTGQSQSRPSRLAEFDRIVVLSEERARRRATKGEPTMAEILASIRRIIAEDDLQSRVARSLPISPVTDTLRWMAQNPGVLESISVDYALEILWKAHTYLGKTHEYLRPKIAEALERIGKNMSIDDVLADIERMHQGGPGVAQGASRKRGSR